MLARLLCVFGCFVFCITGGVHSTANAQELFRIHRIQGIQGYSTPFSYQSLQVSNDGKVVGTHQSQARVWQNGETTDLGFAPGGLYSHGIAANDTGSYLGNVDDFFGDRFVGSKTGSGPWEFSRWPEGGYQFLAGSSMNNRREFVGYASSVAGATGRAFYHPGTDGNARPIILGDSSGHFFSSAMVINNNGLIGGNVYNNPNSPHAKLWDTTGRQWTLGATGVESSVAGLNDSNTAVGYFGNNAVAWVRNNNQYSRVNILEGNASSRPVANAINNRNVIVGNTNRSAIHSNSRGFIWLNGAYDLNQFHRSSTVIYRAEDINNKMQIVGQSSEGAFLANPIQNRASSGNWNDASGSRWGMAPDESTTVKLAAAQNSFLQVNGSASPMVVADLSVGTNATSAFDAVLRIDQGQDLFAKRSFWGDGKVVVENTGILIANGTVRGLIAQINGGLAGEGLIDTLATEISGIHAPGNSAGIQTFTGDLRYRSGSILEWELFENETLDRGGSFDGIDMTTDSRTLSIEDHVTTNLFFNSTGSSVAWTDSFWREDREWTVFTGVSNLTATDINLFDIQITQDSLGSGIVDADSFEWVHVGDSIVLRYTATAVPEPYLGAITVLGIWGLLGRRRRS